MSISAFFRDEELKCKRSGILIFHPGFIDALDLLQGAFGDDMTITSACRSFEHNQAIGGHPRSLHVGDFPYRAEQKGTLAVDVAAVDGGYRGRLFVAAWSLGWSVGWNAKRGFLHLDRRDMIGLPQTSFDY